MIASGGLNNTCTIHNIAGAFDRPIDAPVSFPFPCFSSSAGSPSLHRVSQVPSRDLVGHGAMLSGCRFVNDQQILTCSGDSLCILWDVERATRVAEFTSQTEGINTIALAQDKKTFLAAGTDSVVRLYDFRDGLCHRSWDGNEADVNCLDWFPDGQAFGYCFVTCLLAHCFILYFYPRLIFVHFFIFIYFYLFFCFQRLGQTTILAACSICALTNSWHCSARNLPRDRLQQPAWPFRAVAGCFLQATRTTFATHGTCSRATLWATFGTTTGSRVSASPVTARPSVRRHGT
jgi:hypothetical protein